MATPGSSTDPIPSLRYPLSQQASRIDASHTVRRMREIVIYEEELDHVGLLNTLASGFFSAASGCFLFAVGLLTNWVMQGTLTEKGTALLQLGLVFGGMLSAGFLIAGIISWKRKGSLISAMKQKAIDIDQPSQSPLPPPTESLIQSASDIDRSQP